MSKHKSIWCPGTISATFCTEYISATILNYIQPTILVTLTVPIEEVIISTTTEGDAITGQQYTIVCTVSFPIGMTSSIVMRWYGSDGLISNGEGITIGETITSIANITSSLEFSPIRIAHGGHFSCRASINSNAPPYNITKSSEFDILVDSRFISSPTNILTIHIFPMYAVQLLMNCK